MGYLWDPLGVEIHTKPKMVAPKHVYNDEIDPPSQQKMNGFRGRLDVKWSE